MRSEGNSVLAVLRIGGSPILGISNIRHFPLLKVGGATTFGGRSAYEPRVINR